MHFSYVKEKETEKAKNRIETAIIHRKRSMSRKFACSFKRSCSIVKSRDELTAESAENAPKNKEQDTQQEQTEKDTDSLHEGSTEPEVQDEQSSQTSSFTEEEKVLSEEKVDSQASEAPAGAPEDYKELQYKPATIPQRNRFQAGITFVDPQGYVYAQEVKEGRTGFIIWSGTVIQ